MGQVIHPAAVSYQDIDLSWMIGRVVASVSYHDPKLWYFGFEPNVNIGVECLWRVVEPDRVVLTSEDHNQKFGLPAPVDAAAKCTELLAVRRIAAVVLRVAAADLVIEFSGDLRLEVISNSIGYDNWRVRDPSGTEYFAQGGGQISKWKS